MCRMKSELPRDFILFVFDHLAVKLDQVAASGADQMIVVLVIVLVFVAATAIAHQFLARQSAFDQQPKRAINRREADARIFSLDQLIKFLGARMAFGAEKDIEDQFALSRAFEPGALQMIKENFLLFIHQNFSLCLDKVCHRLTGTDCNIALQAKESSQFGDVCARTARYSGTKRPN